MHTGVSYMDDLDVYYYHCHTEDRECELYRNKWYKVVCFLILPNLPIHKNVYFIPHPRLEEFLRYNPERLMDIEPVEYEYVLKVINSNSL